jgi:2-keto-4-pentenoate hydratase/2-oxohepta-3-ene-1,7-dioic acid hydratase in catechol pathway
LAAVRLVTVDDDGLRTGLVVGDEIVDLTDLVVGLPASMVALLDLGEDGLDAARRAPTTTARRLPLDGATVVAPVPRPPSFVAIARNYDAHIRELGHERPEFQTWFTKQPTCVIGPGAAIEVPRASSTVDYEGELAMVIGRRCRHVPAARALEVVAGYTVVNDVSVRDWQWRAPTMMMGKGFDTHGPCGPWLVTADEVADPQDRSVRTWVNDELRQDGTTADMIFTCADMIEHLSTAFTLEPGMVISTGTPAGVAAGGDPPRWLVAGDTVTVTVEGIGTLTNPVIDEPEGRGPVG